MDWNRDWFENLLSVPQGYWKNKENQRKFFDSLQNRFDIQHPKEWGKVTLQQVIEAGGVTLLDYYQRSIFKTLCSIYPGIYLLMILMTLELDTSWNRDWFPLVHKYPSNYFELKENQLSFLNNIAVQFDVRIPIDWVKIPISLIRKEGGGVK